MRVSITIPNGELVSDGQHIVVTQAKKPEAEEAWVVFRVVGFRRIPEDEVEESGIEIVGIYTNMEAAYAAREAGRENPGNPQAIPFRLSVLSMPLNKPFSMGLSSHIPKGLRA